jgi:hypothetical protein
MHGPSDAEAVAESEEHMFHFMNRLYILSKYGSDTAKDCEVVGKIKV